ncbi:YppF family protein [Rossellomorea aquimaris]|uniref:YppF family protein n=1 Tax=Rossellomorea aquimaris TaxID=189382 RepID=UPI0007D04ABF|nr:YppF family protein [Rossellomorea aquimaris]
MTLNELLKMFENRKQYEATDQLELLTMAKKLYISNEISYQDYKKLVKEINETEDTAITN